MASTGKKTKNSSKLFARIVALVLGVIMVASAAIILIEVLAPHTSAAEVADAYNDVNVRVGLVWGSSSVTTYPTTTLYGFSIGIQQMQDSEKAFTPLLTTSSKSLCVANNTNLVRNSSGFSAAGSSVTVGGCHIELSTSYPSFQEVQQVISQHAASLSSLSGFNGGCYAFPVYVNGVYKIRVYDFASRGTAEDGIAKVQTAFPEETLKAVSADNGYTAVVDPETLRVVMEFTAGEDSGAVLGIRALDNPKNAAEEVYVSDGTNLYEDVLAFRKSGTGGTLSVINVIQLENYVEGVLPYEISNAWPLETQKAFAIVARTYIMSNLGRRESLGFDLYNNSSDQVYRGAGLVNDMVRQAALDTRGKVLSYNGELCAVYYANCFGNASASPSDVWGGQEIPYLKAVLTPWESYTDAACKGGFWIETMSAAELASAIKKTSAGAKLTGSKITAVEILEYAADSTYIKSIKVTDNDGNSVTINSCSDVRAAFGMPSANFVIGKGSVTYQLDTVSSALGQSPVLQSSALTSQMNLSGFSAITSGGVQQGTLVTGQSVAVLTASGLFAASGEASVLSGESTDISQKYVTTSTTMTVAANSSSDFVIVGKGYGHGVGISQYGAKCLGQFGYDYQAILDSYFTGVTLVSRSEISAS